MSTSASAYVDVWSAVPDYEAFPQKCEKARQSLLDSPKRFQAISEREDRSDVSVEANIALFGGKYYIRHRGCMMMKTTNDLIALKELLTHVRPATVIELGTYTGGSAVWMADMLKLEDISPIAIYSMDINTAIIQDRVKEIKPPNVTFMQGDSNKIEEAFSTEFLEGLLHPWVVIDDAHKNVSGVLEHFAPHMIADDYLVVEDTNPMLPGVLGAKCTVPFNFTFMGNVLLETVKAFLVKHEKDFAVDSYFTDLFGYNSTSHWHGFIKRM